MPAWWNSLETMTLISTSAKSVGLGLGILTAICAVVVFFSGRQVDALKEKRDADRHLTVEQRRKLIELLKDRPKGTFDLIIGGNREADDFGREIASALVAAGWTLTDRITTMPPGPRGLRLIIRDASTVRGLALREALVAIQLDVLAIMDAPSPPDSVDLYVGDK